MKISVIGAGYVGLVASCSFANSGHQVIGIEKNTKKLELLKQGISPIYENELAELLTKGINEGLLNFYADLKRVVESDVIFIAVGTPSMVSGQVNLEQVYEVINQLTDILEKPAILVMKSTVPPGTGESIKQRFLQRANIPISYVSNPEFLREGKALWDWYNPDRIIIGGDDEKAIRDVTNLYADIDAPKIKMDITSAEMVKYASNAFLATKISFINEIANLCELVGADIDDVSNAVGMDKRIGKDFLKAGLGYGGSCFPKDTKGLYHISSFNGYSFDLLKSVIEVNTRQRINAVRKLSEAVKGLAGKRIAILGLAFKPGTDDIREAPILDIIPLLLSEGAIITVYDPLAMENAHKTLPQNITFADNVYECIEKANGILLATEWQQFVELDWNDIKDKMLDPYVVLDGRNALNKQELKEHGFVYLGIGR